MEKYFGNAYRGDPGVPHADPERFANIWIGSTAFSVLTYFDPYIWQLSHQYNFVGEDWEKKLLYEAWMRKKELHILISWRNDNESKGDLYGDKQDVLDATRIAQEKHELRNILSIVCKYIFCWHDKAFLFEHYHWKQAKKKNQPYKFKWNQKGRDFRDSYYFNWPFYFP